MCFGICLKVVPYAISIISKTIAQYDQSLKMQAKSPVYATALLHN